MQRVNYSSHEVKISQMLLNLYSAVFRVTLVLKRVGAYTFISLLHEIGPQVPVRAQNFFKFCFEENKMLRS